MLLPATNPTLPIVFDPAGIEGKVNTSTSPILLVPAGNAVSIAALVYNLPRLVVFNQV